MRRVRRHLWGVMPVVLLLSLWVPPAWAGGGSASYELTSPDKRIRLHFELAGGSPSYRVANDRRPLVASSKLGLRFEGMPALDGDFVVQRARRTSRDIWWKPVWGEYDRVRDHYNELTVDLREVTAPRRTLRVVFRAYDDGVGVPLRASARSGQSASSRSRRRTRSSTSPTTSPPGGFPPSSAPAAAMRSCIGRTPLSEMQAAATPVTIDAGAAGYATLHEADLIDYATMMVEPAGGGAPSLRSSLVPLPDGVEVRGTAPHRSPWRTLVIGDDPGDLIESTLILNLNPPCAICGQDPRGSGRASTSACGGRSTRASRSGRPGTALPHGATPRTSSATSTSPPRTAPRTCSRRAGTRAGRRCTRCRTSSRRRRTSISRRSSRTPSARASTGSRTTRRAAT